MSVRPRELGWEGPVAPERPWVGTPRHPTTLPVAHLPSQQAQHRLVQLGMQPGAARGAKACSGGRPGPGSVRHPPSRAG